MRRIGSSNSEKGEFAGVGTALAHSHAGGRAHLQAIDGPEIRSAALSLVGRAVAQKQERRRVCRGGGQVGQ
jgi:hypothetical protein